MSRTGIESSEVEVVAVDALNGTAFPILCRSSRAAIEPSFCTPPGSISPQPSAPRPSPRLRCQRKANAKCRPPRPSRYPRWLGALPWTNRPADFLDNSTLYDVGTIGRPFRCVNLDLMHQANHTRCTIMKHARRHIRCACCAEGGAATKDHVVPRALYPSSKPRSTVPRITIPACLECNAGLGGRRSAFPEHDAHCRRTARTRRSRLTNMALLVSRCSFL